MDADEVDELNNPVRIRGLGDDGSSGKNLGEYCDFVELTLTIRNEDDTTEELTATIKSDGTPDNPEILSTLQGDSVALLGHNREPTPLRGFQIILHVDPNVEEITVTLCGNDYAMPTQQVNCSKNCP
ncbi:hypothetical protein F4167_21300 [Candidatus Poribacteria bacterium]|nr:hypothetical protein [Candidatus Poribacteria bacterium]MYG09100.1 hypothetical protein [Candidatus Poribacteria bacterium]